ncbi:MAG: heme exporter protein CcmD [Gammaproteobacteria bacterium]
MTGVIEFFQMGGYAVYVWTSYGLTLLVLCINGILPVRRERNLIRKLSKQYISQSLDQNNEPEKT